MTFNQWAELIMFTIVFITFMYWIISEIKMDRSMKKWFDRIEKEYEEGKYNEQEKQTKS